MTDEKYRTSQIQGLILDAFDRIEYLYGRELGRNGIADVLEKSFELGDQYEAWFDSTLGDGDSD